VNSNEEHSFGFDMTFEITYEADDRNSGRHPASAAIIMMYE